MADDAMADDANDAGSVRQLPSNQAYVRVYVPDIDIQKCISFTLEETVWMAKTRVLASLQKDLKDACNFGLYCPPANGRAGKFLEEERPMRDYPLTGPIGYLEFKYKRRLYKALHMDEKQLKQLHTKASLKRFVEYVKDANVAKVLKLCDKGLDPNFHENDTGETPLTIAAKLEKPQKLIAALINGGAHVDFRARSGLTALHVAAVQGNAAAVETLLDLRASPNYKDGKEVTPLYYSCLHGSNPVCCEMLLKDRSEIGAMDSQGLQEIHLVCKHGFAQHLDLLLFYGAEMNAKNASGNTPLHVCCINNQDSCARLLLFRGADKNAQNFANQTPYQVSVVAGNLELADIIKNHGTDEIVPFRETPKYSNRRRMSVAAHPGTPQYARPDRWQGKAPSPAQSTRSLPQFSSAGSTLSLSDSSSNMNHADVDDSASSYNSGKSSNSTSPVYVSPKKRLYPAMPGRTFVCVKPYLPKEDGELALKKGDFVDVLSIGERGFWEGKVGHREGWFPNDYVEEVQMRRRKGSDSDDEDSVILNKNTLAALVSGQLDHQPKTVVLQRSNKGFGFVLRGARSLGAKLNFHPTDQFPALQYLDDVDKDGMGWKAGLRPGDFVIEINGEDVRTATHKRVVQLIQGSGELVALKVITVKLDQNTKTMTLPLQRKSAPKPPARDPRTSLSVGRARANSMVSKLAEIEASMARRNSVSYDSEGRSTKSSSIESLQTALGGGEQPRTASIKARPTSRRITAQELQEIFVRQGASPREDDDEDGRRGGDSGVGGKQRGLPNRYARRKALYNGKQFASTPDLKQLQSDAVAAATPPRPAAAASHYAVSAAPPRRAPMYKSTESLPTGVLRGGATAASPRYVGGSTSRASAGSAATLTADIGSSTRLRSSSITLPSSSAAQGAPLSSHGGSDLSDIEAISSEMDELTREMEQLCASSSATTSDADRTPKNSPERDAAPPGGGGTVPPIHAFVAADGYVASGVIKQVMVDGDRKSDGKSDRKSEGKSDRKSDGKSGRKSDGKSGRAGSRSAAATRHESDSEADWDLGLARPRREMAPRGGRGGGDNVVTAYSLDGGDMYYSNSLPRNYQRRMQMEPPSPAPRGRRAGAPYGENPEEVFIPKPDYDSPPPPTPRDAVSSSSSQDRVRRAQRIRSHSVSECRAPPREGAADARRAKSAEEEAGRERGGQQRASPPRVSPARDGCLADAIMIAAQAREKRLQEQQQEAVQQQRASPPRIAAVAPTPAVAPSTERDFSTQHVGALMNAIAKRKSLLESSSGSDPEDRQQGAPASTAAAQQGVPADDDAGEGTSPFGNEFARKLAARRRLVDSHGDVANGPAAPPSGVALRAKPTRSSGGQANSVAAANGVATRTLATPAYAPVFSAPPLSTSTAFVDPELVRDYPTTALPPPDYSPPAGGDRDDYYYVAPPVEPPEAFRGSPVAPPTAVAVAAPRYDIRTHDNYVTKIEVQPERASPPGGAAARAQALSPEFLQRVPAGMSPDKRFRFTSPPAPVVVRTVEEGLEVYDVDLAAAALPQAAPPPLRGAAYRDARPTVVAREPLNSSYSSYFSSYSDSSDDFNTIKRAPASYLAQRTPRWSPEAGYHSATPSQITPPPPPPPDDAPDYIAPEFRNGGGARQGAPAAFSREAYYRHKYGLDDDDDEIMSAASDDEILTVDLNGSRVSMMVNGTTHEWSSPGGRARAPAAAIPARRIRSPQTVRRMKAGSGGGGATCRDGRSPGRRSSRSPARSGHRSPARSGHRSPARSGHRSPGRSGYRSPSEGAAGRSGYRSSPNRSTGVRSPSLLVGNRPGTRIPVRGFPAQRRSKSPVAPPGSGNHHHHHQRSHPSAGNVAVLTFREKPIANWSSDDVADWLDNLKLKALKQRFVAGQVNGQKLVSWSRQGFAGMGIKFADMALMQQSLQKMRGQRSRTYQI